MSFLYEYIFQSNIAKTAGAAIGGSTISVGVLMSILNASVDDKIDQVNSHMINYVDMKHENVLIEMRHMKELQIEMNTSIKNLDDRIFNMHKRKNSGN